MEYNEMMESIRNSIRQAEEMGYMAAINRVLSLDIDLATKVQVAEILRGRLKDDINELDESLK